MALNTYPYSPFPASTEQLHKSDNEELQAQIDAIKDGTDIDSFGDVEAALSVVTGDITDLETDKADLEVVAAEFDAEAGVYAVGDLVTYDGKLYEFTSAHSTAGAWDASEVTEKTVADEIDTLRSGLTNLRNDVEGAWTALTFTDVITMSQDVALSDTPPEAYRRGNIIRLRIYPTGTLTISGGGYKTIGTLSNAYKPSYPQLCAGYVNKAASGSTLAPVSYVVNASGNINLIYGSAGTIGNENHGWMDGSSIWLEWSLS